MGKKVGFYGEMTGGLGLSIGSFYGIQNRKEFNIVQNTGSIIKSVLPDETIEWTFDFSGYVQKVDVMRRFGSITQKIASSDVCQTYHLKDDIGRLEIKLEDFQDDFFCQKQVEIALDGVQYFMIESISYTDMPDVIVNDYIFEAINKTFEIKKEENVEKKEMKITSSMDNSKNILAILNAELSEKLYHLLNNVEFRIINSIIEITENEDIILNVIKINKYILQIIDVNNIFLVEENIPKPLDMDTSDFELSEFEIEYGIEFEIEDEMEEDIEDEKSEQILKYFESLEKRIKRSVL
jgi:hypothetical protein